VGDDFAGLIERHRDIDIAAIGRRVLNDSRYEVIWRGGAGGCLMIGNALERLVRAGLLRLRRSDRLGSHMEPRAARLKPCPLETRSQCRT
jgi:hypothetical protein